MANAQEVTGAFDVALLLWVESGKAGAAQALLSTLPTWRNKDPDNQRPKINQYGSYTDENTDS